MDASWLKGECEYNEVLSFISGLPLSLAKLATAFERPRHERLFGSGWLSKRATCGAQGSLKEGWSKRQPECLL